MVVDEKDTAQRQEEGQSLVEFLLMLPMLIGMTIVLLRINTAIQVSIVDQQYARAQALFLAFNSPIYPSLNLQQSLIAASANQMVVGVSDNISPSDGSKYVPQATVQNISRRSPGVGSNAPKQEPTIRSLVRVRNTVTLCTPTFFVQTKNGPQVILPLSGNPPVASGASVLSESTNFNNFCGSTMAYEQ